MDNHIVGVGDLEYIYGQAFQIEQLIDQFLASKERLLGRRLTDEERRACHEEKFRLPVAFRFPFKTADEIQERMLEVLNRGQLWGEGPEFVREALDVQWLPRHVYAVTHDRSANRLYVRLVSAQLETPLFRCILDSLQGMFGGTEIRCHVDLAYALARGYYPEMKVRGFLDKDIRKPYQFLLKATKKINRAMKDAGLIDSVV